MQVNVLLVFEWRDGPTEGVLRSDGKEACWYFKMMAQRQDADDLDDRLFGLWSLSEPDSFALVKEFGDAAPGTHVWPAVGSIGSSSASEIVDRLLSVERTLPETVIRTTDFSEILGTWTAVP